ncbi:MAG TPA: glycosyltransferase family 9 protein [Candidatus Binatia bacterium]|nr:glycosyltransferase family 9 protein [Candidatus Binatia bacterium]
MKGLYQLSRAAKKILALDLGFLGDSVHLVPALWEIKRHYAEAEVHTLSAPVGAEMLGLAPCVDRAWAFPLGSPSPPWWRHWDVIRALRGERFDLVFNFSGADRSVFLTALMRAKWRVAYAGNRKHFWSGWLIGDWVSRQSADLAVYEQRREMLAGCGLELAPPRWDLRVPEAAKLRAVPLVPAGGLHFSINASTPLKEWPLPHWIELAKRLLAGDGQLRITATASANSREQQRLHALAEAVANERLSALPPGLPIADLAAVLQRCRLHLGADSGVLHLAMALGLPTLALFREYAGTSEWLPRGATHQHLLAPCACANLKNPPCAIKGEALCLRQITPEKVQALVIQHPHPQPAIALE